MPGRDMTSSSVCGKQSSGVCSHYDSGSFVQVAAACVVPQSGPVVQYIVDLGLGKALHIEETACMKRS